QPLALNLLRGFQNWLALSNWRLNLSQNQGFEFSVKFWVRTNSFFLRWLFFKFIVLKNWRLSFSRIISSSALPGSKNQLRGFGQSFGKQAFLFGKVSFVAIAIFGKVKFLQSASKFSVEVLANWLWAFCQAHFSGKGFGLQSHFFSKHFGKFGSGVLYFRSFGFRKVIIAKK
ncbi:MAG: hypothetical protein U5M23_14730, partial [Marinagarivorans sp.]|nr:hypothetical protein [Marinagarivorans sp.]